MRLSKCICLFTGVVVVLLLDLWIYVSACFRLCFLLDVRLTVSQGRVLGRKFIPGTVVGAQRKTTEASTRPTQTGPTQSEFGGTARERAKFI